MTQVHVTIVIPVFMSSWLVGTRAAPDVSSTSALPDSFLTEDFTVDYPLHHFDMTPEAKGLLKGLARLDRNVLKTIDENHNTLFETIVPSMILESHNFSAGTADCGITQNRLLSQNILQRKEIVDKKIDGAIDQMIHRWDTLKSVEDAKTYFLQFWEERNAIYKYVTHREKDCHENIESCQGLEALEEVFRNVFMALSECKEKFWQP